MTRRARPKPLVRAGIAGAVLAYATLTVSALAASPAYAALHRDDGDDPGPSLGRMKVLGIFVGIPLAAFLLIALVVSIPSMIRGPRYRPGKEWQATPEWYGAPGEEAPEIEGGSGAPALAGSQAEGELTGTIVEPAAEGDGGGTSARW
jgi:hypothetical protein